MMRDAAPAGNGKSEMAPPTPFTGKDVNHPADEFRLQLPHLSPQQLQFLMRVSPGALESERTCEIPACVTIAQAILESATAAGWGSSSLFRLANNPFGIKYEHISESTHGGERADNGPSLPEYGHFDAATWEVVNGERQEVIAQFQRFPDLTAAFEAHAQLLRSAHYAPAFAVRNDWRKFAERLGARISPQDHEHCGYSTSPRYGAALIQLVELYRLDDPRVILWLATGKAPGRIHDPAHSSTRRIPTDAAAGAEYDLASDEPPNLKPNRS